MTRIDDLARQVAAQLVKQTAQETSQSKKDGSDHDLLIQLGVKMDVVTKKVDDLSNNTTGRIESLESRMAGQHQTYLGAQFAETAGTTTDPKLVVTYTASAATFSGPNLLTLLGVG